MDEARPGGLRDPARLTALRGAGLLDTGAEEAFDRLTRLAARVLNAPSALVSLVDHDRQYFKSALGLSEPLATTRQTPISHSYCRFAVESRAPLVIEDARQHPLVRGNPAIEEYGAIAYAGAPLVTAGGHALGTLCVVDDRPRRWQEADVALLCDLAASATAEIELRLLAAVNAAILDAAAEGIRLTDLAGNTITANAAMRRLVAEGAAPPLERKLDEADFGAQTADGSGARTADLGADRVERGEYAPGDSGRRFASYSAPARGRDGRTFGRVHVVREVTVEREVEQLKSELMATVSHELRTPLASIVGFSELLVQRTLDEGTRNAYVRTIHGEAQRLAALINDFLDLQRIEEGALTLALEPFELAEVLERQVRVFSGQSAAHVVELAVPDRPLVVAGDPDRISQVLANLLSNAIKYSPVGGRVRVTATSNDGFVHVAVSDEGIGIPEEQQDRLFTKFFRVDSSDTRRIGGTGLGLALAREIVEAHGGHMGVDSSPGRGSTFWFELPGGVSPGSRPAPRVLVIEADGERVVADAISAYGYDVEAATTAAEGVRRARANPPSAICLDAGLGDAVDPWEVLAQLKESPATAATPVIVCGASADRRRAAALGAADVLVKPFSGDLLRETVARVFPPLRGTVLVVDDEEPVRRLVVETLGREGIEMREARDGEEALAVIESGPPDVVILDLAMPRVDGFAVLDRLRSCEDTRSIPVVVLTARHLGQADRERLLARTATLLEKSAYSVAELRRLVDQALGLRQPGHADDNTA